MELSKQVISLEIAKRLKELGVKQESVWWWHKVGRKAELNLAWKGTQETGPKLFSAFTIAELGKMLPRGIVQDGMSHELKIIRSSVWRFYYGEKILLTAGNDDSEADARGKFLVYLLENNLYKI